MVTPANFIGKQETEIFDFINKKLVYLPQEERPEMDSRKLKDSSERYTLHKHLSQISFTILHFCILHFAVYWERKAWRSNLKLKR